MPCSQVNSSIIKTLRSRIHHQENKKRVGAQFMVSGGQVPISAPPLMLGQLINLAMPQFPLLQNKFEKKNLHHTTDVRVM